MNPDRCALIARVIDLDDTDAIVHALLGCVGSPGLDGFASLVPHIPANVPRARRRVLRRDLARERIGPALDALRHADARGRAGMRALGAALAAAHDPFYRRLGELLVAEIAPERV